MNPLLEEDVMDKLYLFVIVEAMKENIIVGSTLVFIKVPTKEETPDVINVFERAIYRGIVTSELTLEIDQIGLNTIDDSINLTFELDECKYHIVLSIQKFFINIFSNIDDSELFTISYFDTKLVINLARELTEIDIKDKITLQCVIIAQIDDNFIDRSAVLIELPSSESCQPQNPDTTPKFENTLYSIRIEPTASNRIVGQVKAIVPSQPDTQLVYSAIITDEHLKTILIIDSATGDLTIQNIVTPGVYRFEVTATNPTDNSIGHAEVILTVSSVLECPSGDVFITNSLIVKKLKEDVAHPDILPTKTGECEYQIFHVEPQSQRDLFEITNDMLGSSIFQRESDVFAGMIVPQIQVTLKLVCDSVLPIARQRRAIEDWNNVLVEDIPFSTDTTILTIIIEDVNNNAPEFIEPTGDVLLGYPEPALAEKLLPQSLIQLSVSMSIVLMLLFTSCCFCF